MAHSAGWAQNASKPCSGSFLALLCGLAPECKIYAFSSVMFCPALEVLFQKCLIMSKKCLLVALRVWYKKCPKNVGELRSKKSLFVLTHSQGCFNVCVGLACHLRSVHNVAPDVNHFTESYSFNVCWALLSGRPFSCGGG